MAAATRVQVLDSWYFGGIGKLIYSVMAEVVLAGHDSISARSLGMAQIFGGSWAIRQTDDKTMLLIPNFERNGLVFLPKITTATHIGTVNIYFNPGASDATTDGTYRFTAIGSQLF